MRLKAMLLLLALMQFPVSGHAADPAPAQPAQDPDSRVSVLTAEQVKQILDQTVDWYRMLGAQQQAASQTSDLLILYANRQIADKVVALAFDLARANAELLSSEANSGQSAADAAAAQAAKTQRD
ncbi:MAG TPA: hypothetical protein VGD54_04040, partial [Steroidobacteraceae bacterium]